MPPTGKSLSRCKNVQKMTQVQIVKKVTKINLRSIFQPHAYLQSMATMSAKFQKYQYKIVGGVAHTRYPLSIH